MLDSCWSIPRVVDVIKGFLPEVKKELGATDARICFDQLRRAYDIRLIFRYCDLEAKQERIAGVNFLLAEEDLQLAIHHKRQLQSLITAQLQYCKETFSGFNLKPDADIENELKERGCQDIFYSSYRNSWRFVNALGEKDMFIPTPVLVKNMERYAPRFDGRTCLTCGNFDNNPYLPCAIDPITAQTKRGCKHWETRV